MASGSKKVIYAALAGNSLIAVTKFIAGFVTRSSAMFSEGIHSLVDTGNQILLLWGLRAAKKPSDKYFPFGHGKEIYFWSFIVAISIFGVGAGVSIYEGVHHIVHPEPVKNALINYIVLGLAMLFEGFAWVFAFKEFTHFKGKQGYVEAIHQGKDPTLFVILFEDSAAMLGLVVAFLGIFLGQLTGIEQFDGIASVIIGLILGGTALWLAFETKGLLIGEAANSEIIAAIKNIAQEIPEIEHVNEVLTLHMGPDFILLNLSADFAPGIGTTGLEDIIANLDKKIKTRFPQVKRIFIEAEAPKVPSA